MCKGSNNKFINNKIGIKKKSLEREGKSWKKSTNNEEIMERRRVKKRKNDG